jgi:hypothetical protein
MNMARGRTGLATLAAALILMGMAGPARGDDRKTVLELLFDAPHRMADSLMSMPAIDATEKPFAAALQSAVSGDIAASRRHAGDAGYTVVEMSDAGRRYVLFFESGRAGIGPTVAIAVNPARDLVIEAPHPIIDRYSDRQAAVLFLELGARALVIAGANRCAAKAESPCSGKTRVCGDGNNPYRASDPAHNPATLFHVAHRVFSRQWPQSVVVQPHGFNNGGSSVWFVISDGSTEKRADDTMLSGRVRDALRESLGRERAVSCQDPNDRGIKTRWLCAANTVQGRDLNGSADACRSDAPRSSGRFLHIEQTYEEVRRGFGLDWQNLRSYPASAAILAALAKALPCMRPDCAPAP